ncbi:MAG: hypothetical protein PWQ57_2942 [Desulfovibrionales bacterium]|nr:hypothetical protein [Desulfovibrionales bacterium]
MSRRIFILLLAAILVWAGVYALSQRKDKQDVVVDLWPEISKDTLRSLKISYKDRNFTLFKDDAGGWRAKVGDAPGQPRVLSDKVDALVDVLSRRKPRRDLGDISSAKARGYGLNPPAAQLHLENGRSESVMLGNLNPSNDGVYAVCTLAPERLLLLDVDYLDQVKRPAEHYFDMRLIRAGEQEVRSFSLSRGNETSWSIEKDDSAFSFRSPQRLRNKAVSTSEARFYLHNLLSTDVDALLLTPVNATLTPLFSVSAELDGGRKAQINVFRERQGKGEKIRRFANSTWQPGLFLLGADRVAQLNKTSFDMRQRKIVSMDTAKATNFTIVQSDKALGAFKNATGWHSRDDKKDLLGIDMSLWRLTDLQFEAEPTEQLPATAQPAMTWTLKDDKGEQLARIVFYSDPELPEGRCWLYIDGKSNYYPVSNQLLKDLQGQLP